MKHHRFCLTGINVCFLTNIYKDLNKGLANRFRTCPVDLMQPFDKNICTEIATISKTSKDASSHPAIAHNVYILYIVHIHNMYMYMLYIYR